jgi:hypothetical protein
MRAVQKKQLAFRQNSSWLLYYNTLIKHNSNGSYSPDLSPAVFFLFPKLKLTLKGYKFGFSDKTHKKCYSNQLIS